MKILVISQYWAPENGVPQRRWSWLSKILHEQGHAVTVLTPPPSNVSERTSGSRLAVGRSLSPRALEAGAAGEMIARTSFSPGGVSLTVRAFNQVFVAIGQISAIAIPSRRLKGYRPDVVIGTVPALPTAAVTLIAALRYRCPYIIDLRDAWPDLLKHSKNWNDALESPQRSFGSLPHGPLTLILWLTKKFLYGALRRASAVIVTSKDLADDLNKRETLRRCGRKTLIYTVRNVFPVETRYQKLTYTKSGNAGLKVLYAGTMGRAQDLKNALEAVRICRERGIRVNLRFVGNGAAKRSLSNQARDLQEVVEFESHYPAENLDVHYEWADTALVHLADWEPLSRTVPSKLYELMEVGVFVSAVVSGETASLVEEIGAGRVVPPNNPEQLALLWEELALNKELLMPNRKSREWVINERENVAPKVLSQIFKGLRSEGGF